ncbi:hypothetical protein LPW11_13965 [Geomonas sp. RF6]|uniref:NACHT and WD repeat domain-containing protein n=1 Tax=Geomonas sp. RF6 TaxID=2897342 RepID=UPI001E44B3A2|nr:hypothetical protein [Geomonas sp. RF6]UFS68999.1 hypothetical protein LPW11_13965 [Geomonas sp. RF6]
MTATEELILANPFPGLRPFCEGEADRFFGRAEQIEELAARLQSERFVAVAGASGCGKSSLVCAGVLSRLSVADGDGGGNTWRCAVMRPGNQPITNLAQKLSPIIGLGGGSEESRTGPLLGRLRLGGLGLVEAVGFARLEPGTRVLVVVDQFEEIFRFRNLIDPNEAAAFIKLLLNAARTPQSPVSVIITLRSETLGSCADFLDLPEAVSRGQYLVPKLTRDQRKEAITEPVLLRGHSIAPRLVQRLLNDVSSSFDDLPVMQHVLSRTWNRWAETCEGARAIDLEDYEAVGAAKEAICNHAEQAYASLAELQPVAEKVFRALTERVSEGIEVRRPLNFDHLCRVTGALPSQVAQIVDRFRQPDTAFLMPHQEVSLESNPVIDISHESLIRQWQRLREWAGAEARSRAMLLRVADAARLYEAKEGSLWRERNLERAREWRERTQPTPEWVALYASGDSAATMKSMDRFLELSCKEAAREQRLSKVQRWGVALFAVALLVIVAGAAILRRAASDDLAGKSLEKLNFDPAYSALLASAAVHRDSDNENAEYALRQSLALLEMAHTESPILSFSGPVRDLRYSPDGTRLVVAAGTTVTLLDAGFKEVAKPVDCKGDVFKAWLAAKNSVVVAYATDPGGIAHVKLYRAGGGSQQLSCGPEQSVSAVCVSPDDRHVAVGCAFGEISIWDASVPSAPPKIVAGAGSSAVTALAFSSDGSYLASGQEDGTTIIWREGHRGAWIGRMDGKKNRSPMRQGGAIRDIAFHPATASQLVTASDDTKAIVWNLDLQHRRLARTEPPRVLEHLRPVYRAKFAKLDDQSYPVLTVSDKVAKLWIAQVSERKQRRRHDSWVVDAEVSPNGTLLVTASSDGTARLWSTRTLGSIMLRGHRDGVSRALFTPAGDRVITGSYDGTVRVWRFKVPHLLSFSEKWALNARYNPSGDCLAVGDEGGCGIIGIDEAGGSGHPRTSLGSEGENQYISLSWSGDGKHLVATKTSNALADSRFETVLWDVEKHEERTPSWLKRCTMATFNPERKEMLTLDADGKVKIWKEESLNEENATCEQEVGTGHNTAAMSPDGRWVASTDGNTVLLWDRRDPYAPPKALRAHNGAVFSLEFSKDSKKLVSASSDLTATIWSVEESGRAPIILKGGHIAPLSSASFSPAGDMVVTGSADNTICVWDARTGHQHSALRWHTEGVNDVRFSPSGREIVSASDDGAVKIGECDACWKPLGELRKLVEKYATVSESDRREIAKEKVYLRLPGISW